MTDRPARAGSGAAGPQQRKWKALGAACCLASALGYTVVNSCKRLLTVHCDRPLMLSIQDSVSVVVVGAWLFWQARRGRAAVAGRGTMAGIVLVGLASQFLGNLPVLWAMSVIGLAATITAVLGMSLAGAAVLGRVFLGERVSIQSAVAAALLIISVVLIGFGAGRTNDSMAASAEAVRGPFWVTAAISAACMAGLVYAALGVAVRKMLIGGTSLALVLFIVPASGVATLGPISFCRLGIAGILATHARDAEILLAAGALNLLAYLAALHGLRLVNVLHANVLSASQVAMAALAGFLFFSEPASLALVMGVLLTVAGMILLDPSAARRRRSGR